MALPLEDVIAVQRRKLLELERPTLRRLIYDYATVEREARKRGLSAARRARELERLGQDKFAALLREGRLRALEEQVRDRVRGLSGRNLPRAQQLQRAAILQAVGDGNATLKALEIAVQLNSPAIERMSAAFAENSPLRALFGGLPERAQAGVRDALIRGVGLGINPRETARAITREVGLNLTRALTITRTETLRAYRMAELEFYRANSDVVAGWVWVSAADSRSCAFCWSMHGTEHTPLETMSTHPNCRCKQGPLARRDPVHIQPGTDRFARLPEHEQRAILGTGKFNAFKSGEMRLEDVRGFGTSMFGATGFEKPLRDIVGASKAAEFARVA